MTHFTILGYIFREFIYIKYLIEYNNISYCVPRVFYKEEFLCLYHHTNNFFRSVFQAIISHLSTILQYLIVYDFLIGGTKKKTWILQ